MDHDASNSKAVLGNDYVSTAALLSLTSFFNALSLSRTLSNSLETSLCSLAFAYYPWDAHPDVTPHVTFNKKMILFSALACVIRPTNAVIWTFLYMRLLWAYGRYRTLVASFVRDALLALTVATLALFVIDTLYYGKSTFTPYNFLLTNLSSVSLFYGGSPWHYYLSQALPILCTTALPFTLHGMYTTLKDSNTPRKSYALQGMFWTIVWSVGIYSLAGHKEWRFIHPLLPLLHVFAAKSLVNLRTSFDKASNTLRKQKPKAKTSSQSIAVFGKDLPIRRGHLWFLLCMAPATIYVVLFYCSGPISVLSYVRSLPLGDQKSENPFTDTVGFLTPCHSTPGHAYIHREVLAEVPGRIWALGCEPPLGGENLSSYQDQTDVFFASPKYYITNHFPPHVNVDFPPSPYPSSHPGQPGIQNWRHEWPKHLILFGDLLRDELGVKGLLEEKGYQEVRKYGRDWEGEGKRKGGVRVWTWQG
ncbi:GPI mannosyltransferase 3 [Coprinopsis cinerea okayama7|uniref:Mannosyltransferase n=1 Tax=Coprinopsis cinerea (strain Okayama-7 / 130 / ATCC MYA-4618 / FGSC 9003) TaxID=240176 RepID=D6RKF8_COPC7|nr:GPI mannosyltransferase 3 [Coprinopsis cinerea okayama7\|eukprot:XP_002911833.1 GPI mannosyltransferase 3 [Coprinopsis cinerea okayama7\